MNKKEARRDALGRIYSAAITMANQHLILDEHYYSASDYKKVREAYNEECEKLKNKLKNKPL